MASTNKTINYDLSQYTANDKPTYLVDYNSDMNKIDTQMKANSDLAGLAKTEADDLSSRVDGQDVIIGTLNTTVGQHTNEISSLNTDVSAVDTKVGDLTDLNTTDKTDVVSAVNEVNTKVGVLSNLITTDKTDIVSATNEVKLEVEDLKAEVESKISISEDGQVASNAMTNYVIGNVTYRYYDLTFAKQYSQPPIVIASVFNNSPAAYDIISCNVSNITTTGCRLLFRADLANAGVGIEYLVIPR